jgi:hypothetical protein
MYTWEMSPTKRPSLPARTQRSSPTRAFDSFWRALSEINDFNWFARAGFDSLRRLRPPGVGHPKDFIAPEIAAHLNVDLHEFDRRLAEQAQRLLCLTLVDVVTFYEEFLLQTLMRELPTRPGFKPQKPLAKQVKAIINGSYEKRPEDLDKALGLDIVNLGSEHELDIADLKAAFLARNCIVHAGGVVGDREILPLATLIPGLAQGDLLPLSESLWRRFLDAMGNHAQDIDLLTRVGYRCA